MSIEPTDYKSASVEYDTVAHDMHGMLDRSDARTLLSNLHLSQHPTQAYGNLLKNINAYAIGDYSDKDTPFHPSDLKRLLKRTKELRDGFVFGMTANHLISPYDDDDHLFGVAVNNMARIAFQDHSDRELGVQELEGYGIIAYNLAFGEFSLNPANPFRWLTSEVATDLYSDKTSIRRFRSGIGMAYCALAEVRNRYNQTFTEITKDF